MTTDETDEPEDLWDLAQDHTEDAIAVLAEIKKEAAAPGGAGLPAEKPIWQRGGGKTGSNPPEGETREPPVGRIVRVIVDPRRDSTIQESLATHSAERPS